MNTTTTSDEFCYFVSLEFSEKIKAETEKNLKNFFSEFLVKDYIDQKKNFSFEIEDNMFYVFSIKGIEKSEIKKYIQKNTIKQEKNEKILLRLNVGFNFANHNEFLFSQHHKNLRMSFVNCRRMRNFHYSVPSHLIDSSKVWISFPTEFFVTVFYLDRFSFLSITPRVISKLLG